MGEHKMSMLDKAIIFAVERHSGSERKGTDIPYIVHPLEAVSIAAGMTDDPEILAAAVLHDVVEDTWTTMEEIKTVFGERVEKLVAAESEDKMPDVPPEQSWKARKEAAIKTLASAEYDAKIVALADKLSNIRAIHRDFDSIGDKLWERFNQKDKNEQAWYYREVGEALSELKGHLAYQEYRRLVDEVFG